MSLFRNQPAAQNDNREWIRWVDAQLRKFFQGGKFNFAYGSTVIYIGHAFNVSEDALYVTLELGISTQKVARLSPVSAYGVWTDITDSYPHASQGLSENIGMISP